MMVDELPQASTITKSQASPDVLVVGAGIIGLSIAWKLTEGGAQVLVLDAGSAAAEASWAGAGMLTAGSELRKADPWLPLGLEGLDAYPGYVRRLSEQSGLSIDYRECGAIEVAASAQEWEELARRARFQSRHGMAVEVIDSEEEIRRMAPGLAREFSHALYYPRDAVVNPRDVTAALRVILQRLGCRVEENSPALAIRCRAGECVVETPQGSIRSATVVMAAGAWSSSIPVESDETPVRLPRSVPVKGHRIGYQLPPGRRGPVLRHGHAYLLQRSGGLLIAGSNEERIGFDRSLDPAAASDLARRAAHLMPELAEMEPAEVWIGFRPAVRKNVFPVGNWVAPRICLAYGHYRNGILMAPSTAQRIASGILAGAGSAWQASA